MKKLFIILASILVIASLGQSRGAPGDLIQNVSLPVSGFGVSVGVDCEGNVYYTLANDINLYRMDKDGNLTGSVPIVDTAGNALAIDEITWDNGRQVFWGQLHGSNPIRVYQIDPLTGTATFAFDSTTISIGSFRDGIAYDASDDTLYITGDVSDTIEQYQTDGTFIRQFTPTNAAGGTLGLISGVAVGAGDLLYLGRNGAVEIVQVKKSDGSFIASFASPGGARDEGLECDAVNFAPKLALWSREFASPGFMSVIEIEPGTCECGGGARQVPLDIHPQSCPNPLNTRHRGFLPVAVLGTDAFDVSQVDVSTIQLAGVAPVRSGFEDIATPFEPFVGKEDCLSCTTDGPDGFLDLTLKFDAQEILAAIGPVDDGDCVALILTGALLDGTPIVGEDVVLIRMK